MTQFTSPALSPPLLFATDGSPSAQIAQAMVHPIATFLAAQNSDNAAQILVVVTVQPRPAKRLLRSPKPLALPASSSTAPPSLAAAHQAEPVVDPASAANTETADPPMATMPSPVPFAERSPTGLSLQQLTQLVHSTFPAGFPLSLQIRQGRPTTEILNCARAVQAGLIAVGHRGTGGVRELLLGSVSTAIARYAPCSVLVARMRSESPPPASLNHVLLVVDSSAATQQALATARQLIPAGIETVTLLHIQPPLNTHYLVAPFVAHSPSWQLNQSLQEAQREQGEQILQTAIAALNDTPLTIQTRLHVGDAGPSICQIAQEVGANLIILGNDAARRSLLSPLQAMRLPTRKQKSSAQPRPVLRNTRLSVTDDYVIHYSPCPVLLCRRSPEAS